MRKNTLRKSIPAVSLLISLCFMMLLVSFNCGRDTDTDSEEGLSYFNFSSQKQLLRMAYIYKKGKSEKGETVLLFHGKNFSGSYWNNLMDRLLENGFNVIAPDQVGFGRSSLPVNYQYSFEQLAVNTKNLLDTLHLPTVHVLGHSMGGMLAIRFALMYPEICKQLLLENPIGLEDTRTFIPYSTIDAEYKKELKKTRSSIKKYMIENYFHDDWKESYEELLDQTSSYIEQKNFGDHAWNMALTSDMVYSQPVCQDLEKIRVPTVLFVGQADRTSMGKDRAMPAVVETLGNYPDLGKKAHALITESKLVEFKGVGHIPHIEIPVEFSDSLLHYLGKKDSRHIILTGLK